ncbi:MAG: monovalent cation:proton antiporter-2 (CPA2) family protein [Candidatus Thiodiazotropha taylori]|nr:monovalent cation:proton antiporter-2 (CPA2) family protein [Candidatus Thiodiazotropha taylori]RLW54529.1 MAG: potassium transporter [gamma proteobacterium symbiont of Stewartia floridana]MCG7933586.1 monovalent cation:proton antiporter-2 (CPA2) family protein [Candidatus Thiodiazotropha taylori]MCG7969471.1 monovalent cation:proton antiporter-2 (CPA2) family protein [Candidatus Thiodiazotropha taylori]MCG7975386.1 monovalent cation:proton antiporter-2 (CPA2) family protein [Candidatus Thio
MGGLLFQAFIYLCAAVIAVPIAKRLGLGSVLGYLLAGIFIGPVIGLVGSETQTIQHFAEFGVVMMLFLVGLELQPRMLWEMRNRLIGLGGLQVALTTALITAAALMMGLYWSVALTVGLIFSLSSTAIVLQTLNEKGLSKTEGGRAGFSVLLFQDIAVIPMLALIPLLALPELVGGGGDSLATAADSHGDAGHHHGMSLVAGLPGWAHALVVLGAIASVLLGGHFLSRPMFRFIAESRLREIFTASALMLVIGIALLMTLVDLSPALGTFLAGVVLANSEFRHELESDIEPFKGLLLGLFFITVGAGIDFNILFNDALTILSLTVGVIVIKGLVLYGLARAFRLTTTDGWLLTLGLAQAGEFGFVLLSFSLQNQVLPAELASTLSLVVALSMLLTPVLFILYDKLILNRQPESDQRQADNIDETGSVIIAGNGRFGQIVNRLLVASGVQTTVLDHQADIINMLSKVGVKSYYGDASRPELLHAAGIESAKAVVIAIDDRSRTLEMVEHIRRHYPEVKILARAFDVNHLYLLNKAGVDIAVRELFDSSLELGKATLKAVGVHPFKVEKMSTAFRKHDENGMNTLYELWDENTEMASNKAYLARARELGETLKEMMETDRMQLHDRSERGWTPPPKHYTKDMGE